MQRTNEQTVATAQNLAYPHFHFIVGVLTLLRFKF